MFDWSNLMNMVSSACRIIFIKSMMTENSSKRPTSSGLPNCIPSQREIMKKTTHFLDSKDNNKVYQVLFADNQKDQVND